MSSPTDALPPHLKMPTVGAVIVNYNTYELTVHCVASLLKHGIVEAKNIVIVDNASPDGSGAQLAAEYVDGPNVIVSARNGGFGAGVNQGVSLLDTELALVLNPDTRFLENRINTIQRQFAIMPRLGIVGLRLINPDGTLQYSARRFYSLLDIALRRSPMGKWPGLRRFVNSHLLIKQWTDGPFESDWVMGTGLVLRRTAFDAVGRMDEGYFLYFEEVDLCARMWVHGWSVLAHPHVPLVHDHQRHSKAGLWSKSGRIHFLSMLRFFEKFGVPLVRRPKRHVMSRRYKQWLATHEQPVVERARARSLKEHTPEES